MARGKRLSADDEALRTMNENDAAIEMSLCQAFIEAEADGELTREEYIDLRSKAFESLKLTQALGRGFTMKSRGQPVTLIEASGAVVL